MEQNGRERGMAALVRAVLGEPAAHGAARDEAAREAAREVARTAGGMGPVGEGADAGGPRLVEVEIAGERVAVDLPLFRRQRLALSRVLESAGAGRGSGADVALCEGLESLLDAVYDAMVPPNELRPYCLVCGEERAELAAVGIGTCERCRHVPFVETFGEADAAPAGAGGGARTLTGDGARG